MKSKKSNKWEKELFNILYKLKQTKLDTSTDESKTTIPKTSKFDDCKPKKCFKERKQNNKKQTNIDESVSFINSSASTYTISIDTDDSIFNNLKGNLEVSKRYDKKRKEENKSEKHNSVGIECLQARLSNEENRLIEVDQKLSFTFNRLADNEKIISLLKDEINQLKVSLQTEKDNHTLTNKRLDYIINTFATNSVASQSSFITNLNEKKEVTKTNARNNLYFEPNYYSTASIKETVKRGTTNTMKSTNVKESKDVFSNNLLNSLVGNDKIFLREKSEEQYTKNLFNSKLDTAYRDIQKLQRRLVKRNNYFPVRNDNLNKNYSIIPSCNVSNGKAVDANSSLESLYQPCQSEFKVKNKTLKFNKTNQKKSLDIKSLVDKKAERSIMMQKNFAFDPNILKVSFMKISSSETSFISSSDTDTAYFSS